MKVQKKPTLADRIAVMKPQLLRLNADVLCLQEVHGQETEDAPRQLLGRVLTPCEKSVPISSRYSLFHNGKGEMIDHLLASREIISYYSHTEIHNEMLHDESFAFSADKLFPESDHAPVIAQFNMR